MNIAPVGAMSSLLPGGAVAAPAGTDSTSGQFDTLFGRLIDSVQGPQASADRAVQELASGGANNLHEVMTAVSQAELSFRFLLEVRNRLTEAYQDVMRMQL